MPGVNLVVNGSFEAHGDLSGRGLFNQLPGWELGSGVFEVQHALPGTPDAVDGLAKLELDARGNGRIYQEIGTDENQLYELSLYYTPRLEEPGTDSNDIRISWGGRVIGSLGGDRQGWRWHRFEVRGKRGLTRLELAGSGLSDRQGGLIDGVQVKALPYASGNLLKNPSFERHGALGGNNRGLFSRIPGWESEAGMIEVWGFMEGIPDAVEGLSKIALGGSRVYQDVATEAGQVYELSLAYSAVVPEAGSEGSGIKLWWEGRRIALLRGDRQGWKRHRFTVTATGARSQVLLSGSSGGQSGVVDDLRLQRVIRPTANLLENPSFERHGELSAGRGSFESIPGWGSERGGIEVRHNVAGLPGAVDGLAKIELDGNRNSRVLQRVDTVAGVSYALSFFYSPGRSSTGSTDISVSWGGVPLARLDGDSVPGGWSWRRFEVRGLGSGGRLSFAGEGNPDGRGGLIDGLSLTPLPWGGTNLIVNPSFEQHGLLNRGERGLFSTIPGWEAASGRIEIQHHLPDTPRAFEGIAKLELDGVDNSRVLQEIATDRGQAYQLSFAYSPRVTEANTRSNNVGVWWNDEQVAILKGDRQGWRRYTMGVKGGASASSRLLFGGLGPSDGLGGLIDDVRLYAVIGDNSPPRITSVAATQGSVGQLYRYPVIAIDPDDDPLSYELLSAPAGLEIDGASGLIEWIPEAAGAFEVIVRVTDGRGGADEQGFIIGVEEVVSLGIVSSPNTSAQVDSPYRYPVEAAGGRPPLVYSLTAAPLGMNIDPDSGLISWTPVDVGEVDVTVEVRDSTGSGDSQSFSIEVVYDSDNLPPVFAPIADQTVAVGTKRTLQLSAEDPEGKPIVYGVTPLPLPSGAFLHALTGVFEFKPGMEDVGLTELVFSAGDGRFTSTQRVVFTVPEVDERATTRFSGRVLDANSLAQGIALPIVNAVISFLGTSVEAPTDAEGYFFLDDIPVGNLVLSIDGSPASRAPGGAPYASFREKLVLLPHVHTIEERPFSMPRLATGSLTQIVPVQAATVVNRELGVSLEVPPGAALNPDGSQFVGQLSISEVPRDLAPAALPSFLDPGLLITIQPAGVQFTTPLAITFPNVDDLPPGSEVDIWSVDPTTGRFEVVGTGRVSPNGESIETISGGIRAATWSAPAPAPPDTSAPENNPDNPGTCPEKTGSSTCLNDGKMSNAFSLPAYRSLETDRSWRFIYQSNRAAPRPVIPAQAAVPPGTAVPGMLSFKLEVANIAMGNGVLRSSTGSGRGSRQVANLAMGGETFFSAEGLDRFTNRTARAGVIFDGSDFESGLHKARVMATSHYPASRLGGVAEVEVRVINEQKSPFGAGWMLGGLSKLAIGEDGTALCIMPGGRHVAYRPDIASPGSFISPAGNFSILEQHSDTSYTLTDKYGVKTHYNSAGRQSSVEDRNGNSTAYVYDGADRLERIIDPVGLETEFEYFAGRLRSVTDPAGRVSRFEHDSAGNLTGVSHPDGTGMSYGYGYGEEDHLMTSKTDERSQVTRYTYDSFGRNTSAVLADGSGRAVRNQSAVGLVDPAGGRGTADNPAPPIRMEEVQSLFVDARGNFSSKKLDRRSKPTRVIDKLGRVTEYVRDGNSLATRITRPNGSEVSQRFDALGNLLSQREEFNGATTRYSYGDFSLLSQRTNARGHSTEYTRDRAGNIETVVNELGHRATFSYNSRGQVTRMESPNRLVTSYRYNPQGLLQTRIATPPAGSAGRVRVSRYEYFPTGLLKTLRTADGITLHYAYDAPQPAAELHRQPGAAKPRSATTPGAISVKPKCAAPTANWPGPAAIATIPATARSPAACPTCPGRTPSPNISWIRRATSSA